MRSPRPAEGSGDNYLCESHARRASLAAFKGWAARRDRLPEHRADLLAAAWWSGTRNVVELARTADVTRDTVYDDLRHRGIEPTDRTTAVERPRPRYEPLRAETFAHGDMAQAATAFTTARTEAEQHGNRGEQSIAQANLALTYAFSDLDRAGEEITLAEHLLAGLDQRATALTVQVAALARHAGALAILDEARTLRTEIHEAGITAAQVLLELALVFHHAVTGEQDKARTAIARLTELTRTGDYRYCVDAAHHLAGLRMPQPSAVSWLDGPDTVRARWCDLVQARRDQLRAQR